MSTFTHSPAKRDRVPLLIGLTGPSGSGKTYSALELATGIQSKIGGKIFFVDTEARRGLHYADTFDFQHVPFAEPFSSRRYLEALQYCRKNGASVTIVDSMSHEHEGVGGLKDLHEQILQRMAGEDFNKRERMQMLAWAKPKQERRDLINGLLQLEGNYIFCFRAKETSKPIKDAKGKTTVEKMGFCPIAGDEFIYEMTANFLLHPASNGHPTYESELIGERATIKLPQQFRGLDTRQLTRKLGADMAAWAMGGTSGKTAANNDPAAIDDALQIKALDVAKMGTTALANWWRSLSKSQQKSLNAYKDSTLKRVAEQADTELDEMYADGADAEPAPRSGGMYGDDFNPANNPMR